MNNSFQIELFNSSDENSYIFSYLNIYHKKEKYCNVGVVVQYCAAQTPPILQGVTEFVLLKGIENVI